MSTYIHPDSIYVSNASVMIQACSAPDVLSFDEDALDTPRISANGRTPYQAIAPLRLCSHLLSLHNVHGLSYPLITYPGKWLTPF